MSNNNITPLVPVEKLIAEFEERQKIKTNMIFDELMKDRLEFNERLKKYGIHRD